MKRILILVALSSPAFAAEPFSLFLTEDEQSRFNKDVNIGGLTHSSNRLSLKAVMMMDEANWTIWLNEHKITPDSCPEHVQVVSVSPAEVELIWSKEMEPRTISLKINESVDLESLDP